MPHTSVLLHEVIEYLNLAEGKQVIDATLDGGGHTRAILEQYPGVKVLGIEFDPVEVAELKAQYPNLGATVVNDSYANMVAIAQEHSFSPDAILFDLGVSSWHYASSKRGFSFHPPAGGSEPLDMRFNPDTQKVTAAEIVNTWSKEQLEEILRTLGEEQFSEQIAERITHERREKPLTTTTELVEVIEQAVPEWYKHRKINPATKTFQALRMAVNDELATIRKGLEAAIKVLNPGGRLVVISFHGLEDKLVRTVFKEAVAAKQIVWVTKDTIKPTWDEVQQNPRSRSAKMKIAEKL